MHDLYLPTCYMCALQIIWKSISSLPDDSMCAGCQLLRWLSQTQVEDEDDYDDLETLVREEGIQVFGF